MKKRIFFVTLCTVLLATIFLTACGNEVDELQERISFLENDNAQLQTTISTLRAELEASQADLLRTQNMLHIINEELEEAQLQAAQHGNQNVSLAITYGGEPNFDMSWPLNFGNLVLGLRVHLEDYEDDVEITWHSENESIFTVVADEDGLSATVTPLTTGDAKLVVKVGDRETESWVRITRSS